MTAGKFIAGVVLTILSMVSFQEGGMWIISGVICLLVLIGLAISLFREEIKTEKEVNNGTK